MPTTDRLRCALCHKHIKPGLLMCFGHWSMVPKDQQRAVVVAYGRMSRATGSLPERLQLIQDYQTVRDEAIRTVNVALGSRKAEPA